MFPKQAAPPPPWWQWPTMAKSGIKCIRWPEKQLESSSCLTDVQRVNCHSMQTQKPEKRSVLLAVAFGLMTEGRFFSIQMDVRIATRRLGQGKKNSSSICQCEKNKAATDGVNKQSAATLTQLKDDLWKFKARCASNEIIRKNKNKYALRAKLFIIFPWWQEYLVSLIIA